MHPDTTPAPPASLILRYGQILVAEVTDAFVSDDTWYGDYRQVATAPGSELEQRVRAYVAFCLDWTARSEADDMSADASEFDQFHDVTHSGLWRTEAPDGSRRTIDLAPVFHHDWLSWRYPDAEVDCRVG